MTTVYNSLVTVFQHFKRNNQRYYLISNDYLSKARFLEYITGKQNRKREYLNVTLKEYKGKKYKNVVYVVEG